MIKINNYRYVQPTPATKRVKSNIATISSTASATKTLIQFEEIAQILLYCTEDGTQTSVDVYPFIQGQSIQSITEEYVSEICSTLLNKDFSDWGDVHNEILKQLY